MIKVNYSSQGIKIKVGKISSSYSLPLTFAVYRPYGTFHGPWRRSGIHPVVWSMPLYDDGWATFSDPEMYNALVTDAYGKILVHKKWNPLEHGDHLYKALYSYCQKLSKTGKKPKGVAIGTHDGAYGEWVPVVQDGLTDACLVEASAPQFEALTSNYGKHTNVKLVNEVISTNGQNIEFFEGGAGYTNSVVERVPTRDAQIMHKGLEARNITSWDPIKELKSISRPSLSINELISNYLQDDEKLDWLHLDVEGYDADLLSALKDPLPNLIIFEHEHLNETQKQSIMTFLANKGFKIEKKLNSAPVLEQTNNQTLAIKSAA